MKKLFKNKNFFLLFQGSLVSAIGTSLYGFAAGLYVQDLFGKDKGSVYLSLFVAVSILVQVVLSPIAGNIIDKVNKIKILYITDFIRGLLFFGTLYILTLGFPKETIIWILLGITALASVNQAFFGPAATATIPEIVEPNQIQAANGANSIIQSVQGILGVIAGMFLYELVGFEMAVLINAISFMFSSFSEVFIKTGFVKKVIKLNDSDMKPRFIEDIKFGFKYLKNEKGLLTMMIYSAAINFCFSPVFSVALPYLFKTEQSATGYEIGIQNIVFSVTMLFASIVVGAMTIKSLKESVRRGIKLLTISFLIMNIFMFLVTYQIIGYWLFYGLMIFANVILAVTMIYTNVPINTGMMKAIDPEVRGRVFATISAMSMFAIPISTLAAGYLIYEFNAAITSSIFAVLVIFIAIGMISNKKIGLMFDNIEAKAVEQEAIPEEAELSFE